MGAQQERGPVAEAPLAPRSGPRGATLFKTLAPQDTGVATTNDYADPSMWVERYHELELGAVGTGVAIADYDGDGRPDIFVVSKTESSRLFRNLGNWKFEDVSEAAGVADTGDSAGVWKQGVTFADVNNDGRPDIYVCRFAAPNLLYVNQGDGTFREEAGPRGLAVNDASVMGAFCDFDRDGYLDVYLVTNLLDHANHPKGQRDYLFRNNGDGTFADVTKNAGIVGENQGHSASWWDHDNDGWPDIYVANDFDPEDTLYRNNRDGTFTNVINEAVPHTSFSSMGSDIGDINNDGKIDFLVADMAATTHEKDQRSMAATRSATQDPPDDGSPVSPQYQRNALYLNTGVDRHLEAAILTGLDATDWTWAVRFEDLDNDGHLDLFVTNGMLRESHNTDLIARMRVAESIAEKVRIERASPELKEANLAFRNLGGLRFEEVGKAWGLDETGVSFGAAFGDLDGDGDLDLVYTNYHKGATVLRNDSDTGHRILVELKGTQSNRFGVGAVVRVETDSGSQTRQLMLARGVLSSSEPVVHFGTGADAVIRRLEISWPSGTKQILSGLATNRRYVITEPTGPASPSEAEIVPKSGQFSDVSDAVGFSLLSREVNINETGQNPLLPRRQNRRGPALAAGDIDGDGRDDIVLGGTPRNPARILLGSASGRYLGTDDIATKTGGPLNDGPVLLFDANGDGHTDLLITKAGVARPPGSPDYIPALLLNDGQGRFRPPGAELPSSLALSAGAVAAADFDRSGRLAIFIGGRVVPDLYPLAPRSALIANRGGRFADVTADIVPGVRNMGMVTGALWSDVDGDGWPDLLVTTEWGGVGCFRNQQGVRLEDWSARLGFASAGTGWWNSIAAADFNGDGRPDFVVGNLGLNTQYRADPLRPAVLFHGDFNGDGGVQLVEAYYEGNRMYPWRTRTDLGTAIRPVIRRFPRNDLYARATLEEILGSESLEAAEKLVATEFRSGVFLSGRDGAYQFQPLPHIVQISPVQGLVAGDLDGDGHADIFAAQNSHAPAPVVGRFDGGLGQLLRGDGKGNFEAVPPAESGLVVPGDAKAAVVVDFDENGWPDLLITRNNNTTLAFRNNGVEGRHSLRVRLRGPAGNPTGIGSRITLTTADGTRQTAEVHAGSGYFSQSPAHCFFGWRTGNPPVRIDVRWPSGTLTQHLVTADRSVLELEFSPR